MSINCSNENKELIEVEIEEEIKLKEPSLFKVVMFNDDFTPMDFVVNVLQLFFGFEIAIATKMMYEIHELGKTVCGVYSKDVAETKVGQVMEYARKHDHPLLCSIEAT